MKQQGEKTPESLYINGGGWNSTKYQLAPATLEEGSRGSPFIAGTLGHLGELGKRRNTWGRVEPRMLEVGRAAKRGEVCTSTHTEEIKEQ